MPGAFGTRPVSDDQSPTMRPSPDTLGYDEYFA